MKKILLVIINTLAILTINMRRGGIISPNLQKEIIKDLNGAKKEVKER